MYPAEEISRRLLPPCQAGEFASLAIVTIDRQCTGKTPVILYWGVH